MEEGVVFWDLPPEAQTSVQAILALPANQREDFEALRGAVDESLTALASSGIHGASVVAELRSGRVSLPQRHRVGLDARVTGALLAGATYIVRRRIESRMAGSPLELNARGRID
jgi:hypothetical protein